MWHGHQRRDQTDTRSDGTSGGQIAGLTETKRRQMQSIFTPLGTLHCPGPLLFTELIIIATPQRSSILFRVLVVYPVNRAGLFSLLISDHLLFTINPSTKLPQYSWHLPQETLPRRWPQLPLATPKANCLHPKRVLKKTEPRAINEIIPLKQTTSFFRVNKN